MLQMEAIRQSLLKAREDWALSIEDVAKRAEVEPSVAEAAEQGGDVTYDDLRALARALGGSLDELLAGKHFWIAPGVAFRSRPSEADTLLVQAALLQIAAAARDSAALAELLELPVPQREGISLDPIPVRGEPAKQADDLARRVRAAIGQTEGPLLSVRSVMRTLGIQTFLTSFGTEKVDGMSWRDVDGQLCAAANVDARDGTLSALRITFAHELCHLLFDGTRGQTFGLVERRSDATDGREQRANAFAAYFLAPRASVLKFLRERGLKDGEKPGAEHLRELSRHFLLGIEATAWHLVNCQLWRREDVRTHHSLRTWEQQGEDKAEMSRSEAETAIPLERRGHVLELATLAIERSLISPGRWRELVGLSVWDDWRAILSERGIDDDFEARSTL